MSESERVLMERLAALEVEVKAEDDAKRARKEAALAKVREQRQVATQEAAALRERQTALVTRKSAKREVATADEDTDSDDISGTLELARRAHGVKQELSRPVKQGDKSWVKSGVASMLLGPLGWLYAGSFREAVPASAAWLAFGAIASKLIPMFLLMPVLMVMLPLSGIAGAMYAVQYNRKGARQRLFRKKNQQALEAGAKKLLKR